MEIIQQIGSYAGLAAVVGLAILSALYFSQAREVKRLRDWAGRAPDRAPLPYQPPPRVVAQPVQQPRPPAPPPPPPAAQSAPAQAAAAGAAPAVATGPVAATPAAARAAEGAAGTEASKNTVSHPPPRPAPHVLPPRVAPPGLGGHFAREAQIAKAREEAERADTDAPGDEEEPPETGADVPGDEPEAAHSEDPGQETGEYDVEGEDEDLAEEDEGHHEDEGHEEDAGYDEESDPALAALPDPEEFHEGDDVLREPAGEKQPAFTPPPPPPPVTVTRPPLPPRPAPPPRAPGPILPPYEQSRPSGDGWESRTISPVKAGLAVGGTVLVVGAAAFGVLQMTGDDGASPTAKRTNAAAEEEKAPARKAAGSAVNPRTVTVSVLNGTTIGGLAAKLGDRLEDQGFQLGNVTNNTDQQRAESVVLFAPGAEREAQDVGRRLKIDQREPIDPDSQTRAGDATVVVVAGADLDR